MAIADLITNFYDTIDETKPLTIFDPNFTWKKKVITDFYTIKLHKKIFDKGVCVYKSPSVMEIHKIKNKEFSKLWPEITRLENPQNYFVDLSKSGIYTAKFINCGRNAVKFKVCNIIHDDGELIIIR